MLGIATCLTGVCILCLLILLGLLEGRVANLEARINQPTKYYTQADETTRGSEWPSDEQVRAAPETGTESGG